MRRPASPTVRIEGWRPPRRRCWLAVCVLLLAFVAAGCANGGPDQHLYPEDDDESVHEFHSHMMYKDLVVAGFGH